MPRPRLRGLFILVLLVTSLTVSAADAADRPNILWITSEDNGPELGCYGDDYATTPNIDQLASKSLRYLYCWSNAPVCAPARTTIISGMYPTSLGAEHMRSLLPMPHGFRMYPEYLREAGYYCTNNSKEDYNLVKGPNVWDESSGKAHWKNRAKGQPFFAIFNHTVSHESQLRKRPHTPVHDPAGVNLPAYHPDTPESRQDWAQYYDKLTEMDEKVGENLHELEQAGLADETIVFYYGDHGSGMPRHKRWPFNSGLHVPLLVHIPEKFQQLAPPEYQAGGTSDRLVSFVDLAPTLLSLCGIQPPTAWQGHAFAGTHVKAKQPYIYGFRGRMDERIDLVRSVRAQRFVYIRHFYQNRPYGQYLHYMFQTPTTRKWHDLHLAGGLNPTQAAFWEPKPLEELYDLQADPEETVNLVADPKHRSTADRMRDVLGRWCQDIKDVGFYPEAELRSQCGTESPYDVVRTGKLAPEYEEVLATAFLATRATLDAAARDAYMQVNPDDIIEGFASENPSVRYWACQFALKEGAAGVQRTHSELRKCLNDPSVSVRIVAAEALGRYGEQQDQADVLPILLEAADLNHSDVFTAIAAWNAIDYLDDKAAPIRDSLSAIPEKVDRMPGRMDSYVPRLKEKTLADLDGKPLP